MLQPLIAPSPEFAAQANGTADLYWEADVDRLGFWAKQAARLSWETPFTDVLDWSEAPVAKWFVGGKLNVAYNCGIATSKQATVIGSRSGGRAHRSATAATSLMRSCWSRCARAANALTELRLARR